MTQPPLTPPPAPELPRAAMLSYLTTATTPTRVRHIAARTLRILAFIHLFAAVICLAFLAFPLARILWDYFHRPPVPAIAPWRGFAPFSLEFQLRRLAERWAPAIFTIFVGGTAGIVMWACAAPVCRGRKIPARCAVFMLLPAAGVMLIVALTAFRAALGSGLGLIERYPDPLYLLWLIPGAIAVLAILLLKDLAAFLQWIARNPITEKPPVKFLP